MKIIDDIFSSIAGNAKTRISDPFLGTFLCSWILCNWNNLSLLFWGEGKVTERINFFYNYLYNTPIISFNYVFSIPFLIAIFYLFAFPWVSLSINFFQHWANERLHKQAINAESENIKKQMNLNKEKLKANPEKQFLGQLVQNDIDKKNEILEHIKLRTTRLEAKTLEAKEKAKEQETKTQEARSKKQEAKNKENLSRLELEKKKEQAELEKIRFESNSAKARSVRASHRFPSAYFLMLKIQKSLKEDDIKISIEALGDITAALFGYDNFEELINDENFNNETLERVEYIYYDDGLAKRLEEIVTRENDENEDFSADTIFGHFEVLFDGEPFELITGDTLAEKCKETIENDPYDLLNCDGTSRAIAESDTIFEEINNITIEHFDFDDDFNAELSANTRGYHRREEGVPGRSMTISINFRCEKLVGKYGLGSIEKGEIIGTLDDYD